MALDKSIIQNVYSQDIQDIVNTAWIMIPDSKKNEIHPGAAGSSGGDTGNGWKIHISIDPAKMAEAASIITDLLNQPTAPRVSLKFAGKQLAATGQPSKQVAFVFYEDELKNPQNVAKFLYDVETALSQAGIGMDERKINTDPRQNMTKYDASIFKHDGTPSRFNYRNERCIVMDDAICDADGVKDVLAVQAVAYVRQSYFLKLPASQRHNPGNLYPDPFGPGSAIGAAFQTQTSNAQKAVLNAIKRGNEEQAINFLAQRKNFLNYTQMDENGMTLLHWASLMRMDNLIALIHQQESAVNQQSNRKVASRLYTEGLDVSRMTAPFNKASYERTRNQETMNLISFMEHLEKNQLAELPPYKEVVVAGRPASYLHALAFMGHNYTQNGQPPFYTNQPPNYGAPYSREQYLELVKVFVNEKYNSLSAIDSYFGQTPLGTAIGFDNNPAALALIDFDAKGETLNLPDTYSEASPLIMAIQKGNTEVINALMNRGVDLNKADRAGLTPLHWASIMRMDDVILQLIDKGAKVSAKDQQQRSPLSYYLKNLEPPAEVGSFDDPINKQMIAHFNDRQLDFYEMRNARVINPEVADRLSPLAVNAAAVELQQAVPQPQSNQELRQESAASSQRDVVHLTAEQKKNIRDYILKLREEKQSFFSMNKERKEVKIKELGNFLDNEEHEGAIQAFKELKESKSYSVVTAGFFSRAAKMLDTTEKVCLAKERANLDRFK